MKCMKCGAEIEEGDIFCGECGTPVRGSAGQREEKERLKKQREEEERNEDNFDKSAIRYQMENMRNVIGVLFGVGLFTTIYDLSIGDSDPLGVIASIFIGLFILQTKNFSSTPNNNTLNTLRNIFYIFVAIDALAIVFGVITWGGYEFLLLDLIYFLVVFYLMYQYIIKAQTFIVGKF